MLPAASVLSFPFLSWLGGPAEPPPALAASPLIAPDVTTELEAAPIPPALSPSSVVTLEELFTPATIRSAAELARKDLAAKRAKARALARKAKARKLRLRATRGRRAVKVAIRQLGVPYVWGGTSRRGFDCSGLTQYAWRRAGVILPRTTYGQIRFGRAVRRLRDLRPGDLLFSHRGHVVMFAGHGRVVAAPHSGTVVQLQPLRSFYVAMRRPS